MEFNDSYKRYEKYLPSCLRASLDKMIEAQRKVDSGEEYLRYDCDYCELQSEINVAEVEGQISPEQAWYLRGKYLGLVKEEIE